MNLSKTPFSILSLEAISELANQSESIVSSRHTSDTLLESALTNLAASKKQATLAVGSTNQEELTKNINKADTKRDRIFIGFRQHIEADRYKDWQPDAGAAAENLLEIIARHGNTLYNEGLTVQSALMKSIFEDLDTDQAKADLVTLGMEEWLAQLKTAQSEFQGLYLQRNEMETNKDIPTRSEAKATLTNALTTLFRGLDFLAASQPDIYGETGDRVSEVAKRIVTAEKGRSKEEIPELIVGSRS